MPTPNSSSTTKDFKKTACQAKESRPYEKPVIITYAEEEILDLVGPACTCASTPEFDHHHGQHHRHR